MSSRKKMIGFEEGHIEERPWYWMVNEIMACELGFREVMQEEPQ